MKRDGAAGTYSVRLARHRPTGVQGVFFDQWVAWFSTRRPGMSTLQVYREAKEQSRHLRPRSDLSALLTHERMTEVLQAAEDDTIDLALVPLFSLARTIGLSTVAAYAARRLAPMLNLIPEAMRPYAAGAIAAVVVLVGAGLDAAGWNINVAEILAAASPAIALQVVALRNRIASYGPKTYVLVVLILLVSGGSLVAMLFGHGGYVLPITGPILTLLLGVAPVTLTAAKEKEIAAVPAIERELKRSRAVA